MNREGLVIGINFVILLLLQVFVCNSIYLGIYLNIQIYLMFILFLPINLSGLPVLFLSAFMGLCIDILSGDLGLHMAACTVIGYVRPYLLKRIASGDQIEIPSINKKHFGQYFIYTGILIFMHHLLLFILETFDTKEILFIITRTLVSSVFNVILIGFIQTVTANLRLRT
jgi:rod shape-determining protein MreD